MAARRFFLQRSPPKAPRLELEEAVHALRVLRLSAGDEIEGLDGRGHAWPLRIEGVSGREPRLAVIGAARAEPAAGAPGAPLPCIELLVSWPRSARAEPMLDRLVQLGASAITPLHSVARGPEPLPSGRRRERLEKIAQSACKQSGRLWLPEIREPVELLELEGAALDRSTLLVLDPAAREHLAEWLAASSPGGCTRDEPLVLVVGPEGGFSSAELELLLAHDARTVRLHPHVLRIETAAEAALSLCAAHYHSRSRNDT